jgi:hypothetical protein
MEILVPVLFFSLLLGVFGWLMVSQSRQQKAREAALHAIADQQGWNVERRTEGHRKVTVLSPRGGGWVLRLGSPIRTGGSKSRTSIAGFSEFRADLPNWPDGQAIFSPQMPGRLELKVGAPGLASILQNAAVKAVLNHVVGSDVLADIGRLSPFEAPPGIALSILASEDPRARNLRAIHEVVHGWKPHHHHDRSPPAVILGPRGTTLRLSTSLYEADDIVAFIETGRGLARELGRA